MRAFAGGFYRNLIRMYDYLGVNYHAQPFLFSFTRLPPHPQGSSTTSIPGPRMVYASNFHRIPPIPRTLDLVQWLLEAAYTILCYAWFSICCFFVAPRAEDPGTKTPSESLDQYLQRIHLPQYYVANYLLPLISSVCTCSHQELLRFPASDILDYKRRTHRQQHYVVAGGVQSVQDKLLEGLGVRLGIELTNINRQPDGLYVHYSAADGSTATDRFDLVVLAVSPDVAASLFRGLDSSLSTIPTTTVETVAHTDASSITPMLRSTASAAPSKPPNTATASPRTQRIHFLSTDSTTESVHEQPHGILITTNPLLPLNEAKVIRSARFTRVLRTPHSRLLINSIFRDHRSSVSICSSTWRNGDDGVYLAGGWCWDGMVLLEGCIVSAVRVAKDLGVRIPWEHV